MNVYDFDRTIYNGDSTVDFYFFCLKRHKKILLLLPSLFFAFLRFYCFKIGDKTQFKEKMYRFLKYCDIDRDLDDFWTIHDKKIKKWYLNQQKNDDVIISASPEFLLCPLEKSFNFNVIGSKVDKFNGKYSGTNCYYEEKVVRFKEAYPKGTIDGFYSDHYSDEPLAVIANKAYIVNGDSIYEWDFNKHIKPRV